MVIDRLANARCYHGLGDGFRRAFEFLAGPGRAGLPPGRHEIDGDRVFALAQEYETRPRAGGVWEAHRRYADIQCLAGGAELIGWAPVGALVPAEPYSLEKDCALFSGEGSFFELAAGDFAVFFPWDAHMPGIARVTPAPARKIVVKVLVAGDAR